MSVQELAEIGIIVDVPLPGADDIDVNMVIEMENGSELNFNDGE